jgi:hypothetical protein
MLVIKKILYFILKTIIFALVAGLFYSLSDYVWAFFLDTNVRLKENFVQRLGYYSLFTFVFTYVFGFFILFILNDMILSRKTKSLIALTIILFVIGMGLGYITQGDGWELYIGKHQRIKHILMFGLVLSIYPFVSYYLQRKRTNKEKIQLNKN